MSKLTWTDVKNACNDLYKDLTEINYEDPCVDIYDNALPTMIKFVIIQYFMNDEYTNPKIEIVKQGYRNLDKHGCVGDV